MAFTDGSITDTQGPTDVPAVEVVMPSSATAAEMNEADSEYSNAEIKKRKKRIRGRVTI